MSLGEVEGLVLELEPELYQGPGKAAAAARRVFEECDSDNSGSLEFEEFAVYWKRKGKEKPRGFALGNGGGVRAAASPRPAEEEAELRAAFEATDEDSSGALSVEEVGRLVAMLEPGLYPTPKKAAAAAKKLFKECDSDNSGELDYEEFAVYWKREGHKRMQAASTPRLRSLLASPRAKLGQVGTAIATVNVMSAEKAEEAVRVAASSDGLVELVGQNMTPEVAGALARQFSKSSVVEINLSTNRISDDGAAALAGALAQHEHVKRLNVARPAPSPSLLISYQDFHML